MKVNEIQNKKNQIYKCISVFFWQYQRIHALNLIL